MKRFSYEPLLAELVASSLESPPSVTVILVPTEAEAQSLFGRLQSFCRTESARLEALYLPGFVQAGVFRFESARRVIARRLGVLNALATRLSSTDRSVTLPRFVVCTVASYARIVPPVTWFLENSLSLKGGSSHDLDDVLKRLGHLGFTEVPKVEDVGEFCVRGSILDLWSPGQATPSRVEFFGDEVENIRSFRVADQRSFAVLDALTVLPSREFVWPEGNALAGAIEKFNETLLSQGVSGPARNDLLENLRHAVPFSGVDDAVTAFSTVKYLPFRQMLSEACDSKNLSLQVVALGEKGEFVKAAQEIFDLYETAYVSSRGKNYFSPKPEAIFPKLGGLRAAFENPTASPGIFPGALEYPAPQNSPFALPEPLAMRLRAVEREKFAARAAAITQVFSQRAGIEKIGNLMLICKSSESFEELAGILAKYFPSFASVSSQSSDVSDFRARDLVNNELASLSLGYIAEQQGQIFVSLGEMSDLFFLPSSQTIVVPEAWLLGAPGPEDSLEEFTEEESKAASRAASETLLAAQFGEFTEGDLVVHVQHGIARFRGLMTIKVMDITGDFLALEYAGTDKVYVPVHKMNLVQRYVGAARTDDAVLDSLKGGGWEKRKQKAKAEAEKLARELMEHQAKRAMTPGHSFSRIDENYTDFESAFPFDETPDQLRALREIMSDMSKPKAMDRLLCGDVGFGKTEVAMRAAYRAVLDGKQVAWLVPTTVLAHQHYRSALERFKGFGVNIEILDRSLGASANRVLEDLAHGKVDIIIGTHRLLSKDLKFRDLGLLVVDEEQRFGVLQKEKIKTMSYGIDVLTMTATPIPRTLQMAMLGLRDLSLLTTPPKARLAVKTFVCPFEESTILDSLKFEIQRGGQIFYVHNRVEELDSVHEFLKKLLPQARICIGHGKMAQKELDDTIIAFLEQRFDILLCTTIIESGIDMPNVNTIIVQNADNFGLAQLYQLRGRVGRRSTRGYAYFLTSPDLRDEDEGAKRLQILKEHQELGSGFIIASHDLEMRGAGNILGDEQKGRVSDVGLETYSQMLDDAIRSLGGVKVKAEHEAEIQVPFPAQIPEDYIENSRDRLRIYRRFFGTRTEDALQSLVAECKDRFGPLPEPVSNLAEVARLRRYLLTVGALALSVGDDATEIRFPRELLTAQGDEHAETLIKRILDVCNRHSRGVRLTPDGRLLLPIRKRSFSSGAGGVSQALGELKRTLSLLAGEVVQLTS